MLHIYIYICNIGVSINGGTSKWLVYMENPIKMDDSGVAPFQETSICIYDICIHLPGSVLSEKLTHFSHGVHRILPASVQTTELIPEIMEVRMDKSSINICKRRTFFTATNLITNFGTKN